MPKASLVAYESTLLVRDHCHCFRAQRQARALARRFDRAFRPLNLTSGQFSLLMSLNRAQPPALGAVASTLAMDRTTLTAALKPLARRGLVELRLHPQDGRSRLLALTRRGEALLARAFLVWQTVHTEIDAATAEA
jgi:DNA-binding MarR family transcriptional regulator